jgi:cathepsin L
MLAGFLFTLFVPVLTQALTWDEFVSKHSLQFQTPEEYTLRSKLFEAESHRIELSNLGNRSWTEELNIFSVYTPEEKKTMLGHKKTYNANYNSVFKSKYSNLEKSLPKSIDWREMNVVTAVKDQGHCGSCWAFASTGVIESHAAIKYPGKLFDLSPQQIASCAPNPDSCGGTGGCEGSTAELAFDYVASSAGMLQEFQYGYSSYYSGVAGTCSIPENSVPKVELTGYVKLEENNYWDLMEAVAIKGPIAVSVDASEWHSYSSGIFDGCDQTNPDINHAVILMGYGTDHSTGKDYWLIRNSWSASWGESGYIRLARSDKQICGTDITPQDGTACAGQTNPVKVCGTCGILYDSSYPLIK